MNNKYYKELRHQTMEKIKTYYISIIEKSVNKTELDSEDG